MISGLYKNQSATYVLLLKLANIKLVFISHIYCIYKILKITFGIKLSLKLNMIIQC